MSEMNEQHKPKYPKKSGNPQVRAAAVEKAKKKPKRQKIITAVVTLMIATLVVSGFLAAVASTF